MGHLVVTREGRWMAAVLAAGPEAVLSHRSAGALWGIRPTSRPRIEVTAPRAVRQRPQLESHRATLRPDEISEEKGIPVTTPARTLLDLAATLSPHELERAVERAEINRLPGLFLGDLVARYRGHRGVRRLAAIAADASLGHTITRSELEERFLAFLDEHGLPRPRVNARVDVAGRVLEVDCVWPGPRVVLELDGYATHGTRLAFERDRERDRLLAAAGWRPTRVTWRQLHRHRDELRRDLSGLLAR